jgi:CRP-like cAMP-binding protein
VASYIQADLKNRLLSQMSSRDFALIERDLIFVEMPRGYQLNTADQLIEYCWFFESGVASVVATSADGAETEVGIVGRDGMLDVAIVLGVERSPLRSFVQIAASGFRVPVRSLNQIKQASAAFRDQLNFYAYTYTIQIAQTALANASFSVEERLARWLLMCADRVGDGEIALTHESLSIMLNVRRAGVTLAIQSLERAGFLKSQRGALSITDRAALTNFAHDAYTPLAAHPNAGNGT